MTDRSLRFWISLKWHELSTHDFFSNLIIYHISYLVMFDFVVFVFVFVELRIVLYLPKWEILGGE